MMIRPDRKFSPESQLHKTMYFKYGPHYSRGKIYQSIPDNIRNLPEDNFKSKPKNSYNSRNVNNAKNVILQLERVAYLNLKLTS